MDEAQDMMTFGFLEVLSRRVKSGLEKGRWRIFMDSNNQIGVYGDYDEDAHQYLREHSTIQKLKTNCRNTPFIVKQTQLLTGADIGTSNFPGGGEPVKYATYHSKENCAELIATRLREWRNNNVNPEDIIILSGTSYQDSCVDLLGKELKRSIYEVNETNVAKRPIGKIGFCGINQFKGLERMFVMIIDLEEISREIEHMSRLYVAVTRANAVLWVAVPKEKQSLLEQIKGENLDKMFGEI